MDDDRGSDPEVNGPAFRVNPLVPRNQYVYQVHDHPVSPESTDHTVFSPQPISQRNIDMMRELNSLMAEMGHVNLMDPGESFGIRTLGANPPRMLGDRNGRFEDTSGSSTHAATSFSELVESQPPSPAQARITCTICMGTVVEATTTRCGHVFCGGCIRSAIAHKPCCPICHRNITHRQLIRLYFN